MNKKAFSLVSLFSGGGGLDIGLHAAGFKTYFANDVSPWCGKTLTAHMPKGTKVVTGDIKQVKGETILEHLKKQGVLQLDLLAGGPPCQAFSVFGRRLGENDPRGKMVHEYFRLLTALKPKAFVFENVYGLETVQEGAVFESVKESLRSPGDGLTYDIRVFKLNAVDFGVPQSRERIIIVGSRTGRNVDEIVPVTAKKPQKGQYAYRTVRDAFRGLPALGSSSIANHTSRQHGKIVSDRYAALKPGERDRCTRINKLDLTKPSFTIVCGSTKGGGKGHIHPVEAREVSPRESARIQTFPDDWSFEGAGRFVISQVGNAVPPLLAFAVGNAIREKVFGRKSVSFKSGLIRLKQQHLFPEIFGSAEQVSTKGEIEG